ncbi:peptidase M38 [Siccirubricoccus deserti]|uniref:Amidohydrolase family protein n=1 Tax=Siccirubricoccus deserti TaxID=2013562 RepID=A0A9X0R0X5_9PROT|nr:amidohydrolase family protein [Siccirubricoccus deserti]MBC4017506.1 amidohydrolase family protein [Siccirubricoccus deserti]GGC60173.1 peptidase M38 [Siccirubricoccus deserti]
MASTLFRNLRLFDGLADTLAEGIEILVEGDRIKEVADTPIASAVARVVDCAGRTLMPGLIDAHVHAYGVDADLGRLDRLPRSLQALRAAERLKDSLKRGFTSIRDAGGADWGLAIAIETGLITAPRLFYPGRALSPTGGHGDMRPHVFLDQFCGCCAPTQAISTIADGVDEVRRAVRGELKRGAHAIKIMASGGVASPSDPIYALQYSDEEIACAVWEASAWRSYVLAHAYTPESIHRAVRLGVRSIEHANLIDSPTAAFMAEKGAFAVPTLVTYEALEAEGPALGLAPESMRKLGDVKGAGLGSLEILSRAGVAMGFGTDLLAEMHARQSDEFVIRRQVLPAADVLRSATSVNATLLRKGGELGVIKPGALADLILVEGDPIADIGVLTGQGERIPFVMKAGEALIDRLG